MKHAYILPGILSLVSCIWLYQAVTVYGLWDEGPLGGFLPMLAALITLGFSIASVVKGHAVSKPWHMTVFIPVALCVALVLLTPVVGMLPVMFVLLIVWYRFLEKYSWAFTAVISCCVIGCVWLIFSLWLKVPFPAGMIMDRLY